ncbi:Predicted arabinose efflux permease, MFS family [Tenacibaculum sp. MAR_2009_124]|uniref:MFS transporter n=1 Tax=Tenacibaculum sp. MAR_2009_124 TaxID=1250059 RepID=UPI000895665A|nr:MFS transporter [Tenacibaculum sp. MAR_2009_124]SEB76780.1 Predicted arabinose efflux permease, MFS family [Tenacibaculum sp. MAR_2009_124]
MREKTILGLKENWKQFSLLLIVNAFVGGMVGLERTILPELAEKQFLITATSVLLSFIIVFGIVKAVTNYFTGVLANKIGRKKLLVIGWLVAIPIPFILMYSENWNWIIFANVLLGINQGLTWSSTVVMKIDLVGEKNRGFAMGLNESFGYLSIAIVAYTTGWIAANYGLRPYPFYQGIGFVILGILMSVFLIKDTAKYVATESKTTKVKEHENVFWNATWKDKNLGSISQAGFVNNLNDGMIWGILPVILANRGFSLSDIALIVAIYPAIWGVGQLVTGKLSDHYNKKNMLFLGMVLQGVSLIVMFWAVHKFSFILLSSVLGIGTAIVYPTFLSAIADHTNPGQRAESIGVFRLWRDLGYSFGAIITIVIAQFLEVDFTILCIGTLTMFSAFIIKLRMT